MVQFTGTRKFFFINLRLSEPYKRLLNLYHKNVNHIFIDIDRYEKCMYGICFSKLNNKRFIKNTAYSHGMEIL